MLQNSVYEAKWIQAVGGLTAASAAPSTATDGIAIPNNLKGQYVAVRLRHTATGARTATAKIWGYVPGVFTSADVAVTSSSGWCDLSETLTLASTNANGSVCELYEALSVFTRVYVQLTAVTGTSATVAFDIGFTEEG